MNKIQKLYDPKKAFGDPKLIKAIKDTEAEQKDLEDRKKCTFCDDYGRRNLKCWECNGRGEIEVKCDHTEKQDE